jgi:hypothetical protein
METSDSPLGQHWQQRHDAIQARDLADLLDDPQLLLAQSFDDPRYMFLLVIEERHRRALEKDGATDDERLAAEKAYQVAQVDRMTYGVEEGYLPALPDET